jgi:hypothetical protein
VLVVDDQGRIEFRQVELFRIDRDVAVLISGLSDGERVCVSALETAIEGMRVRTVEDAPFQTDADHEEAM